MVLDSGEQIKTNQNSGCAEDQHRAAHGDISSGEVKIQGNAHQNGADCQQNRGEYLINFGMRIHGEGSPFLYGIGS